MSLSALQVAQSPNQIKNAKRAKEKAAARAKQREANGIKPYNPENKVKNQKRAERRLRIAEAEKGEQTSPSGALAEGEGSGSARKQKHKQPEPDSQEHEQHALGSPGSTGQGRDKHQKRM